MKRWMTGVCTTFALVVVALGASAQGNPRGMAKLALNGKEVSVDYGRPSLKGRKVEDLLGQLKAGQVWRLGADQSTTFTTSGDLKFGDVTVPKGIYSLWARKNADNSWDLVFNKQHGQWGTHHDASQDAYSVPLKQETDAKSAEMVTISLEKQGEHGEFSVNWGQLELTTAFD